MLKYKIPQIVTLTRYYLVFKYKKMRIPHIEIRIFYFIMRLSS